MQAELANVFKTQILYWNIIPAHIYTCSSNVRRQTEKKGILLNIKTNGNREPVFDLAMKIAKRWIASAFQEQPSTSSQEIYCRPALDKLIMKPWKRYSKTDSYNEQKLCKP